MRHLLHRLMLILIMGFISSLSATSPPVPAKLHDQVDINANANTGIAISAGTANTTQFLNYETADAGNQPGDPHEYHASWLSGAKATDYYQAIPTNASAGNRETAGTQVFYPATG